MRTIYRAPVAIAGEKCVVTGMTAQKKGMWLLFLFRATLAVSGRVNRCAVGRTEGLPRHYPLRNRVGLPILSSAKSSIRASPYA
jgi:hypothetical protein